MPGRAGASQPDDGEAAHLELAREIHAAVQRFAADDAAEPESLVAALEAIPERERRELARRVFDELPAEQQWVVLERACGDDEVRRLLRDERAARLDPLRRDGDLSAWTLRTRAARRADLGELGPGHEVVLGLFLPADVRDALERGGASQVCARELLLRTLDDRGRCRVLADVFNPRRGLFVTAAYDEATWAGERLEGRESIELGSPVEPGSDALDGVLLPGARVDLRVDGRPHRGRLHLGSLLVDGRDIFALAS